MWSCQNCRSDFELDREATCFAADIRNGGQEPEDIFFRGRFTQLEPVHHDLVQSPAWVGEIEWSSSFIGLPDPPCLRVAPKSRLALFMNTDRLAFVQPALIANDDGTKQVSWIFVAYLPKEELDELLSTEEAGVFFSGWFDTASRLESSGFNTAWFYCSPLVQATE